jgi:hypothetical protein
MPGKPKSGKHELARVEWDLLVQPKNVPDWQLLPMLHYEYARCYRPVIQDVKKLRQAGTGAAVKVAPTFGIAKSLAFDYPRFPGTPWVLLDKQHRADMLRNIGITEEFKFHGRDAAWQAWEFFDPEIEHFKEELLQIDAEARGSFRIDFSQEDAVIRKQFSKWLTSRRQELIEKYDKVTPLALPRPLGRGSEINDNEVFRPRKLPRPKGREHTKRKCQDYLKALGGLRALRYCDGNSSKAEEVTALDTNKCLYNDDESWRRVEIQAGRMMQRLAKAWGRYSLDYDIFDLLGVAELPVPPELKEPIPTSESDSATRRVTEAQEFLQQNFVLTAMTQEVGRQ